jgi:hypothetical protein
LRKTRFNHIVACVKHSLVDQSTISIFYRNVLAMPARELAYDRGAGDEPLSSDALEYDAEMYCIAFINLNRCFFCESAFVVNQYFERAGSERFKLRSRPVKLLLCNASIAVRVNSNKHFYVGASKRHANSDLLIIKPDACRAQPRIVTLGGDAQRAEGKKQKASGNYFAPRAPVI